MIDTAQHADELKASAGISNKGRKATKPVYAYSLAWHPTEAPTMAEQVQAAKDTLKELGINDHQALIVTHNDTDHPHVHVIVNRVCPETGRMAVMGNDRLKLSQWAESYEKKNGHVFCRERETNNAERSKKFVKDQSLTRQEWVAWKKGQAASVWTEYRQDRGVAREDRKGAYEALWRQKEERFAFRRDEIKQLYKPIWRDVFKRQKDELRTFDAGFFGRVKVALSRSPSVGGAIMAAIFSTSQTRNDIILDHEAERQSIARGQKGRIADASREVVKAWKYDRDQLKGLHKAQDKDRLDRARGDSDKVWKDRIKPTPEQTAEIKRTTPQPEIQPTFEEKKDRRRSENKANRSTLDAFYGDDKAALKKARSQKTTRQKVREAQDHKRSRSRTRKPR